MSEKRQCPECGEELNRDARRCACGWGRKKVETGKEYDHRCTFKSGFSRCAYPVGLFVEGSTSGWCIFHRNNFDPGRGFEITQQSQTVPYLEALKPIQAANDNSPAVKSCREKLRKISDDPQRASELVPAGILET